MARITEIAADVLRICSFLPEAGMQFNTKARHCNAGPRRQRRSAL